MYVTCSIPRVPSKCSKASLFLLMAKIRSWEDSSYNERSSDPRDGAWASYCIAWTLLASLWWPVFELVSIKARISNDGSGLISSSWNFVSHKLSMVEEEEGEYCGMDRFPILGIDFCVLVKNCPRDNEIKNRIDVPIKIC